MGAAELFILSVDAAYSLRGQSWLLEVHCLNGNTCKLLSDKVQHSIILF